VDHFLTRFSAQYDRPLVKLSPEVRRALLEYSWRGNVRELEKTMRRLVVLAEDGAPIGLNLLPAEISAEEPAPAGGGTTLRDEVSRTERRVIAEALRAHKGNKARAARELRVSYPCLLKKIREYGLERVAS
jgi:transcriptional regulator with PAS, ATPase and Fis domain